MNKIATPRYLEFRKFIIDSIGHKSFQLVVRQRADWTMTLRINMQGIVMDWSYE
jgi:hypothetical protein